MHEARQRKLDTSFKENCMKREPGYFSIINSNFYISIYKRFSVGSGF